jgi:hypothetical protein
MRPLLALLALLLLALCFHCATSTDQSELEELEHAVVHAEFKRKFAKRSISDDVERIFKIFEERNEETCKEERQQCAVDQAGTGGAPPPDEGENTNNINTGGDQNGKPDQGGGSNHGDGSSNHGDGSSDHGDGSSEHGGSSNHGDGSSDHDGSSNNGGNNVASPGRKFYIVSQYNNKVVEVPPEDVPLEGVKIQMWDKRDNKDDVSQLWVVGEDMHIRSAIEHGMEFTDSSKGTRGLIESALIRILSRDRRSPTQLRVGDLTGLEMHSFSSHHKGGRWKWRGEMITNEDGFALTIRNADRKNGAKLIQHDMEPEGHKKWKLEYV